MAAIHNDLVDDPLVGDGNVDFTGGQHSVGIGLALTYGGAQIPKNAFASAGNMDFDSGGRLATRRGAISIVGNVITGNWEDSTEVWNTTTRVWGSPLGSTALDGAHYFDTGATEYAVVAQGGELKYGNNSAVYTTIASASYAGSDVYFAQLGDRLYYCDGSGALKYVTPGMAHSAITAGRVTSIAITREGSGYTSVPSITFGSGAATATALLGYGGYVVGATVTAAGSGYSTSAPPLITFSAPSSGVTAQGRVNISQTPSKPKLLAAHMGRLFCASADSSIAADTLYASDILDGESWDLAGASRRIGGDGDPITAIYPWFGQFLLVFKQRSVWRVNCDPLQDIADWEVELVSAGVGCIAHRTVKSVGSDVFFLDRDGVYSLGQVQNGAQTTVGLPVSAPLGKLGMDATNAHKACAVYYRNRYILSYTRTTAPTSGNINTVVYNTLFKRWCGVWSGWVPTEYVITAFGGNTRLAIADNGGKFWTWDDFTATESMARYRDDTTNIASSLLTRAYTADDPLVQKLGYAVQVATENPVTNADLTIQAAYLVDMGNLNFRSDLDPSTVTIESSTGHSMPSWNLLHAGKWRTIAFYFSTNSGRLAFNGIALTAFSDALKPEVAP